ncbi:MAG: hypothetical protein H7838_00180 [Magnetococcus sp. DMHC-8]
MAHSLVPIPEPQEILRTWLPFKQAIGVTSVRTEEDHARARVVLEALLDAIGDDENHPLADWLHYLADQMRMYEEQNLPIPRAEPREVLRFLMDQQALKQSDLTDCAPQGRISDILNGNRPISKAVAKRLAHRFHVHADLFL